MKPKNEKVRETELKKRGWSRTEYGEFRVRVHGKSEYKEKTNVLSV